MDDLESRPIRSQHNCLLSFKQRISNLQIAKNGGAAMSQRNYMSKSVIQLRELALENLHDPSVIVKLKHELSFRTTKAARQLLAEIDSGAAISPPVQPPVAQVVSEAITTDFAVDNELTYRYEALRQTFTVKGSLLSRWGMTELMPNEFMQEIVKLWSTKISDTPDQYGRTKELLSKNMLDLGIGTQIVREENRRV